MGDYKLVVAQQDPAKTNSGPTLGWKCGGTQGARCNTTVSDTKSSSCILHFVCFFILLFAHLFTSVLLTLTLPLQCR